MQTLTGLQLYSVPMENGYCWIPVQHLLSLFLVQPESISGATQTFHLGDGQVCIFVCAWNKQGWKHDQASELWSANLELFLWSAGRAVALIKNGETRS